MIREKVEWITFDFYGTLIEGEICIRSVLSGVDAPLTGRCGTGSYSCSLGVDPISHDSGAVPEIPGLHFFR